MVRVRRRLTSRACVMLNDIIARLHSLANPANREGMARFGINPEGTLGISVVVLRYMAKEIGRDHDLALELWNSGIHEARMLGALIDNHELLTIAQMETWAATFDSWDIVDVTCGNLFDRSPLGWCVIPDWAERPDEFVKRSAFTLMATLAVHDKKSADARFEELFPLIVKGATDERNFVKKAVNWALRQIGKRNLHLNRKAIQLAQKIHQMPSKSARWIASDALRELQSDKVQTMLTRKSAKK